MKPDITQQNAERFTADLWQKITQTGFNALSKNDFYDYVLYLFNKYDENHFLSLRPNYENAQTLRVSSQKIAASKENITLKYYSDAEKTEVPLLFLQSVASGSLQPEESNGGYTLTLEDKRTRAYLDYLLKKYRGASFDVQLSREKISLKRNDFFALCSAVLQDLCEKTSAHNDELERILTAKQKDAELKALAGVLISGAAGLASTLIPRIDSIKTVAASLIDFFKKRQG